MIPGYRDPRKAARAVAIMFAVVGALIVAVLAGFLALTEADGGEHGAPVKVYGGVK
jgi:hypothetical protein